MKFSKVLFVVAGIIILAVFLLFFYSYYRLHKNVNRHVDAFGENPADYGLSFETRSYKTTDGVNLVSWYIPKENAKAVIVLVHGFSSTTGGKAWMLGHAKYLFDAGYTVLMPDLRSVGESEGNKITFGIKEYQDVIASYDYAKTQPENQDKPIGIFGISMGGATTIVAAGRSGKGDFIIASVPYKSIDSLFRFQIRRDRLPSLILPFIQLSGVFEFGPNYDAHSPEKEIKNIHVPILINSAKNDEVVDSSDATALFELANNPKDYWLSDGRHDAFKDNPIEFKNKVLEFLESYATASAKNK